LLDRSLVGFIRRIDCQYPLPRRCRDDLAKRYLAKLLVFVKEPRD
jgi:hypothetical protein